MKSSRLQCFRVSAAVAMAIGLMSWMPAQAQESRCAAADESTAKALIDYERQWAEAGCTHNGIQKKDSRGGLLRNCSGWVTVLEKEGAR
jgi:hypothetical protein